MFGISNPRKLPQYVKINKETFSSVQRVSKVPLYSTALLHIVSNLFYISSVKYMEIATSWQSCSPMQARIPVMKR